MKKVAIIGSVGIPANYGGFETLAEYLTKHLSDRYELTVFCSSKGYSEKLNEHNGAKLKYIPLKANGFQSIPYDIWSIAKAIRKNDTLLILGVAGCFTIPFFRLFFKRKLIVHVDGIEWKRGKWGRLAKWYLKKSERLAAKRAQTIVADNQMIKEYIDTTHKIDSALIPYGADHVSAVPLTSKTKEQYPFLAGSYAFSVCRIEPENNIHLILEAFAKSSMQLVFVGNWQYSDYGKSLYTKFHQQENINLLDPIYEQRLLNEIRSNCSVYVHGHSAGGTNPSLVEAMMLGCNIVAYDVGYNRATTDEKALFFSNEESLEKLLGSGVSNGDELKEVALDKYVWSKIADAYAELF